MSTYTPIASQTLGSATSSVTFTSIPQGYTDLVLVVAGKNSSSTYSPYIQFNGDTGTNYSITNLYGDGSTATSNRSSSTATAYFGSLGATQGNAIVQIQNYSNSTTYKTALIRINDAGFRVYANVMLWRSTAAITSLTVFNESPGTFASGTTFSIYGIQVGNAAQKAQGGNIVTSDGTYVYHTFTTSGAFIPSQSLTVDYLVVAGGGGGGSGRGGGGGAGGYKTSIGGSTLSVSAKSYPVIIGAGGNGTPNNSYTGQTNGSDSVFGSITSTGGGAGGVVATGAFNGIAGGSGGGGAGNDSGTTGSGGAASPSGQGNAGGNAYNATSAARGGGGGGSSAAGSNGTSGAAGTGGAGTANSISGTSVTYAGGGGGGYDNRNPATQGAGGSGGGGNGGSNSAGSAGTANTGGGGGAGCLLTPSFVDAAGGNGGSGVVIIRYAV